MRIGLYGMPTAGKSYILSRLNFVEVIMGSKMLREIAPNFDSLDEVGRVRSRSRLAQILMQKQTFIMDGHYAFGDEIAFTENDGKMYDVILYLFADSDVLRERMSASERNRKYLKYDISAWQQREIEELRDYCHLHNKDFYVLDNPPRNSFGDITPVIEFIQAVINGYSCLNFAKSCIDDILEKSKSESIILLDGDKTLTLEDTSNKVFGYKTRIYDGNFYTGYQAWKQKQEFQSYVVEEPTGIPVKLNERIKTELNQDSYILTSGHKCVWRAISRTLGLHFYCGEEMSAETKYFITKGLQNEGKRVVAYGDGMNDYFMLKQADKGYLVSKQDGTISRSLKDRNLEGITIV